MNQHQITTLLGTALYLCAATTTSAGKPDEQSFLDKNVASITNNVADSSTSRRLLRGRSKTGTDRRKLQDATRCKIIAVGGSKRFLSVDNLEFDEGFETEDQPIYTADHDFHPDDVSVTHNVVPYIDKELNELDTDEEFVCEREDGSTPPISGTDEQIRELRTLLNSGHLISNVDEVELENRGSGGVVEGSYGLTDDSAFEDRVVLPSGAIKLIDNDSNKGRRLQNNNRYVGGKKLLVVRVIDKVGKAVAGDADYISDKFFGTDGDQMTIASGFDACSFGEFTMTHAYDDVAIEQELSAPGVLEVDLDIELEYSSQYTLRNAAAQAVERKLGFSLPGPFDHVAFVVEDCYRVGTNCGFAAYAYVNHWLSLYVKDNYKYPDVSMHELGHNLNLAHSGGRDGRTYTDHTCLMGNPWFEDDVGRMCFNPVKTFQIAKGGGWYGEDRIVNFDSGTEGGTSWSGRLVGVADYDRSDDPIVLKLETGEEADWFLGFNRGTGINVDTKEARDQVTIYIVQKGDGTSYSTSFLKGTLPSGDTFTANDWRYTGLNLVIKVNDINLSASPGYADVEITFGPQLATPPPTRSATPRPTASPTTGRPTESLTTKPTAEPAEPTTASSTHSPTTAPSKTPTHDLMKGPSRSSTDDPCGNGQCDAGETPDTCPVDCLMHSFKTKSNGNANSEGQMFNVQAANSEVTITSLDVIGKKGGSDSCMVYTRVGDFVGHEDNGNDWKLIYDKKVYLQKNALTNLGDLDEEVIIPAESTQAFHIWCKKGVKYSKDNAQNEVVRESDSSIAIDEGIVTKKPFRDFKGKGIFSGGISYYVSASSLA